MAIFNSFLYVYIPECLTVLPWYRWPIEIDGLPNLKMVFFFHGKLLNNQRVTLGDLMGLDNGII